MPVHPFFTVTRLESHGLREKLILTLPHLGHAVSLEGSIYILCCVRCWGACDNGDTSGNGTRSAVVEIGDMDDGRRDTIPMDVRLR